MYKQTNRIHGGASNVKVTRSQDDIDPNMAVTPSSFLRFKMTQNHECEAHVAFSSKNKKVGVHNEHVLKCI